MCDHCSITPSTFCIGDWHIKVQVLGLKKCARTHHDGCHHPKATLIEEAHRRPHHDDRDEEQGEEAHNARVGRYAGSAASSVTLTQEILDRRFAEEDHDDGFDDHESAHDQVVWKEDGIDGERDGSPNSSSYSSTIARQLAEESLGRKREHCEEVLDGEHGYEEPVHEGMRFADSLRDGGTTSFTDSGSPIIPRQSLLQSLEDQLDEDSHVGDHGDGESKQDQVDLVQLPDHVAETSVTSKDSSHESKKRKRDGEEYDGIHSEGCKRRSVNGEGDSVALARSARIYVDQLHDGGNLWNFQGIMSSDEQHNEIASKLDSSTTGDLSDASSESDESSDDDDDEGIPATPMKKVDKCPLCDGVGHTLLQCGRYRGIRKIPVKKSKSVQSS